MEGHSITLIELLTLQAVLGSPVILGAAAFAGYYLRRSKHAGYPLIVPACITLVILAVPASVAVWTYWPFEVDTMAVEFVNLPAVVACSVLTPAVIWLAARSMRWARPSTRTRG